MHSLLNICIDIKVDWATFYQNDLFFFSLWVCWWLFFEFLYLYLMAFIPSFSQNSEVFLCDYFHQNYLSTLDFSVSSSLVTGINSRTATFLWTHILQTKEQVSSIMFQKLVGLCVLSCNIACNRLLEMQLKLHLDKCYLLYTLIFSKSASHFSVTFK